MGIIMFIAFGYRCKQISTSARHQHVRPNKWMWIRITLLLITTTLSLSFCFISQYDADFFLYEKRWKAIYLFESTVYCAQIGTILYEYNKYVPLMWPHKVYWVVQFIMNLLEAITSLIEFKDETLQPIRIITLQWTLVFVQFILIIYSLFIRRQDIFEYEFMSQMMFEAPAVKENQINLLPNQSFIGNLQISHTSLGSFKVKIQFFKDWKVNLVEGEMCIRIKMRVMISNPNMHYIITKTIQDFIQLESQLKSEDKFGLGVYKLPDEFFRESYEGDSDIVNKVNVLKYYLNTLVSKYEYFMPALIEFLEFDENVKNALFREQRNRSNSIDEQI